MPHFKTHHFNVHITDLGYVGEKVKVSVSTSGEFYCYLPDEYLSAIKDVFKSSWQKKEGKIRVHSDTFARL